MVKDDSIVGTFSMNSLFERDNMNRKVFEYAMAWYLLYIKLDMFSMNLKKLRDYGYKEIPRHYEEAILIIKYLAGKEVDLQGYGISDESLERFEGFKRIIVSYRMDMKMAFNELSEKYGDSYFFYYTRMLR